MGQNGATLVFFSQQIFVFIVRWCRLGIYVLLILFAIVGYEYSFDDCKIRYQTSPLADH
jgi:hypothetical protein